MDLRKIQRTGDMHYVYLPTAWCKEFRISSDSTISLSRGSGGELIISPKVVEKKKKNLQLKIDEDNLDIINKIVVSCYINPVDSFKILLEKPLDQRKLLEQKKLINVELLDIENNSISCESFVTITGCEALLKTMIGKIKNILIIMTKNYNEELIHRYEEEIDKNRMLINKAVISSLTHHRSSRLSTIDLYYISLLAKDLERLADHLIKVDRQDKTYLELTLKAVDALKDLIDPAVEKKKIHYNEVLEFTNQIKKIKEETSTNLKNYHKERVRNYLLSAAEVLFDWAITNEVEG